MKPQDQPRRAIRRPVSVVALLGVTVAAGCGSGGDAKPAKSGGQTTAPAATVPATSTYNPKIDPAKLDAHITNPYFVLTPGTTVLMKGLKDGVPQIHTTHITRRTRTIMGVECQVVKDVVTSNGKTVEIAYDWYAQDDKGNVWYFGESTSDYENGVVTSTKGSWEAGVDNAKPGIVMPAHPKPGPTFYQEYRPGIAEDKGQVLKARQTVRTRAGTFRNAVVIRDTNPLDPTLVQHKWYVPGVGVVKSIRTGSSHTETSELVKR
jgi:hypothetical protein